MDREHTGKLTFLLGGARSGKSGYALTRAIERGGRVLFVATAQAFDEDMRDRIDRHRAERPGEWTTLEAPLNTGSAVEAAGDDYDIVIVDCITLLASNALLALPGEPSQQESDQAVRQEVDLLIQAREQSSADWIIISNEVGMGVVPPSALGRVYRDSLGRANQRLALVADEVLLLVAGIAWKLR